MLFYLLCAIIFFAAGFTQGLSGFGAAIVAMPLLTQFMDVKVAVPLCMLQGLVITSCLAFQLRDYLHWKKILPLFLGSLPGIYFGVGFLKTADDILIKILLGGLICGYSGYALVFTPKPRQMHPTISCLAGFVTGVIGGAFSAGGPPAIIFTTLTGWSGNVIKGTLSGFFLLSGFVIATGHVAAGLTTGEVLGYFASTFPAVILGVVFGSKMYKLLDREKYIRFVLLTLMLLGFLMIGSAVFTI